MRRTKEVTSKSNQHFPFYIFILKNYRLGTVTVRSEAKADTRDLFLVTFAAAGLTNKEGFFGTSDPFLVFLRCNEDGSYSKVWESSFVNNSLNPKWGQTKISMSTLCNGDHLRPLRCEIYDFNKSGKHTFMGVANNLSVDSLLRGGKDNRFEIIEPEKQKKNKNYVNSGVLTATDCSIEHHYTFAQYVQGGLEVNMFVAIDFTGSNGDPKLPQSLHYLHPTHEKLNQYEDAIIQVGQVLEPYDTDKNYPVYGFGARLVNATKTFDATTNHCFVLAEQAKGVDGVLQVIEEINIFVFSLLVFNLSFILCFSFILKAYRAAVPSVLFSGPTLFTPIISTVSAITESSGSQQKYSILLIMTDGAINDMEGTIRTLIKASGLPLSVVIIGVGNENFGEMKRLDSDSGLLSLGAEKAQRDIVQFVAYRDTVAQGTSVLAQEVLAEIPNQVVDFMEKHSIVPTIRKA
jgi:hypothetical protein